MNALLKASHSVLQGVQRPGSIHNLRFIVTTLRPKDTPTIGSPTDDKREKIDFPPFIKDLYVGEFNKSILSYAEVLNYDRYFVLNEQTKHIADFLKENEEKISCINTRGVVPDELLVKLRSLDLFGLLVPGEYGGADLLQTEALRLFQELGDNLSLSELFNINEMMCTKALVAFGNEEQKRKYLEKISVGELWTGFCLAEHSAGSDPNAVKTMAVFDEEEGTYHLKGTKTWVTNAIRADLFLVFANVKTRNYLGEDENSLTSFLVDKELAGVQVSSPYDLAGFNGLQVCDVEFDCKLPVTAILGAAGMGTDIFSSINHHNKYMMAGGIVKRLQRLLKLTTKHTLERKQYGAKLSEFELIKIQIGKCTGRIYALESMLYITSGLADVGVSPDIEVESAVIKQFASETYDYVTRTCLSIVGASTNLKDSPFQEYLAENNVLQSWQGSANIIKCFVALSGILHLVEKKGDDMKKVRQPGLNIFKTLHYRYTTSRKQKVDDFHKELMLENHVHPRMAKSAPLVEWAALNLGYCAEHLLLTQGQNIQVNEANLERLSDMTMLTFAMISALSRASRSYAVGHAHAQHEVSIAIPFIFESRLRVEQLVKEIMADGLMYGERDSFYEDAGSYVIEHGGYCATHPLIKNSV